MTEGKTRVRLGFLIAGCILGFSVCHGATTDGRLPDGTEYVSWEKPLQFSKTYYVDGASAKSDDKGPGTAEVPFRTISRAAEVLQPGERVVIAAGTYRECVRPVHGGTGPEQMISYEAAPGAAVFVKGSDTLNDGWEPSAAASGRGGGGGAGGAGGGGGGMYIWKHELTGTMFLNAYNPFALASVPGDWSWLNTKVVDMGPYFRRRGLVFVDGKPLEPMEQQRELGNTALISHIPVPPPASQPVSRGGLPVRTRGGAIMQEVGGTPDARFWVENPGNVLHIRVPADTPPKPLIEVTIREQAFAPVTQGLGYIRVKGITFQHAGNGYPPPQRGLVSTAGGNHWIIEGNTIEWANGVGLNIGNGDWNAGAAQGSGVGHIVRGNTIRYCGVEGIGGMGTTDTVVEDNLIEWCGWADAERGWEAAAIKCHSSRSLLFRRNVVRHIRHANAVWLDSGNSNCRITANVLADVLTVSAAIHMEMNRNYNQIDSNIIWDVRNAEPGTPGQRGSAGSGIFLHASDRQLIAQNLIGRCDNAGVFPVLRPERSGAGVGQEHMVHNNIFARCDKAGVVFLNERCESDGNVFAAMPERFQGFFANDALQMLDMAAWRERGWDKNSVTSAMQVAFDPDRLELTITGGEPLPAMRFFNRIGTDMLGAATGETRPAGPIANPTAQRVHQVDPRKKSE